MGDWLFVIGEGEALRWVVRERRMAFRRHVSTDKLVVGDGAVIYTTRACWHNPTRDRAQIAAVGRLASDVVEEEVDLGIEVMGSSCSLNLSVVFDERRGPPVADLVEQLALTRGRRIWGPVFRRTIVPLSHEDYLLIEATARRASKSQTSG